MPEQGTHGNSMRWQWSKWTALVTVVKQLWGGHPMVSHTKEGTHKLETPEGGASQTTKPKVSGQVT